MSITIELKFHDAAEPKGVKWVEWAIYENQEVQDSGITVNRPGSMLTVEDLALTAIGDMFHTTTTRFPRL